MAGVRTEVVLFELERGNDAIAHARSGASGTPVLIV
jgi:hypothetical protein